MFQTLWCPASCSIYIVVLQENDVMPIFVYSKWSNTSVGLLLCSENVLFAETGLRH